MTTRTAQLAIALALTSSMVIAQSLAAPACTQSGGAGCFKKGTRPHTVRQYYNYAPRAKQPNDDPYIKAIWEEAIGQYVSNVPPDTTAAIFWLKTRGDAAMPAKPNWSLNKNPR